MERIEYAEGHRCAVSVFLATFLTKIRWIKVRYGWVIADDTSLILITALLCLAIYLNPHIHYDLPERERNIPPVTETVSLGNMSQDVTVTATPAYNPNTRTPENQ